MIAFVITCLASNPTTCERHEVTVDATELQCLTVSQAVLAQFIRPGMTNQKQIELLQSEIKHRDSLRRGDREAVREVRDDVKALRSEIRDLFRRHE